MKRTIKPPSDKKSAKTNTKEGAGTDNGNPAPPIKEEPPVVIDQVDVLAGLVDPPADPEFVDTVPDEDLEAISNYVKAYPEEKVFHMTSDGQVFLDKNKFYALDHEKFLKKEISGLKSFTVA